MCIFQFVHVPLTIFPDTCGVHRITLSTAQTYAVSYLISRHIAHRDAPDVRQLQQQVTIHSRMLRHDTATIRKLVEKPLDLSLPISYDDVSGYATVVNKTYIKFFRCQINSINLHNDFLM